MAKISSFLIFAATLMMMLMTSSAIRSSKQLEPSLYGNVMRSGQSFSNGWLTYSIFGGPSLLMDNDCDLKYYIDGKELKHSDTGKMGYKDCSLQLTRNGTLQIKTSDESKILWESKNTRFCEEPNEFASLILDRYIQLDGNIRRSASEAKNILFLNKAIIYCPAVWSTGKVLDGNIQSSELEADNMLFTNFVIYEGGNLQDTSKRYEFGIEECNAVIRDLHNNGEIQWQSWSRVNGGHCRGKLDNHGIFSIVDDKNKQIVWLSSKSRSNTIPGEFALVMQDNGFAVIYGPEAWNAESPDSGLVPFNPKLTI